MATRLCISTQGWACLVGAMCQALWVHDGLRAGVWAAPPATSIHGNSFCLGSVITLEFEMMLKRHHGVSGWLSSIVSDQLNSKKPPYRHKSLSSASGHPEIKISSLSASSILRGHTPSQNPITSAGSWSRRDSNLFFLLYLGRERFVTQAELELDWFIVSFF